MYEYISLAYTSQEIYTGYMDAVFIDFVNSEWWDGHAGLNPDRLLRPEWLRVFRRRWGLGGGGASTPDERLASHPYLAPRSDPLDEKPLPVRSTSRREALEELLELRKLLRKVVETIVAGQDVSPRDITRLNEFLERADVRHEVRRTPGGPRLDAVPVLEGDARLVGAIALSAARFLTSGDRQRLKVCNNSGCRWVFYDETKNRSRRWCDSSLCGNLFKVRRYRSRQTT